MQRTASILTLSGLLVAQQPPRADAEIVRDLASDDARVVAWAANAARLAVDRDVELALRKALRQWRDTDGDDGSRVRAFLLDALIAHSARLPDAELEPMLEDPHTEIASFVLLCLEPRQNERTLRRLFRSTLPESTGNGMHWRDMRNVALGKLLAAQKSPGFAALLWQRLDHDLHVTVSDAASGRGRMQSFPLPESRRVSRTARVGFPGEPRYCLWAGAKFTFSPPRDNGLPVGPNFESTPGDPLPITFLRLTDDSKAPSQGSVGSTMNFELQWLEAMARVGQSLPFLDQAPDAVSYTTDDAYVAEIQRKHERFVAAREALRTALLRAGALTPAEARKCATDADTEIDDRRRDRKRPLPALPAR